MIDQAQASPAQVQRVSVSFSISPYLGQVRERLRAALERVTTLEEQLVCAHQQVSYLPSFHLEAMAGLHLFPTPVLIRLFAPVLAGDCLLTGGISLLEVRDLEGLEGSLLFDSLQVSSLQQGSGVRDGVAEDEGTVELGPKGLWKVGHRELHREGTSYPRQGVWALPCLHAVEPLLELNLELSPRLSSLSSSPYPISKEIYRFFF